MSRILLQPGTLWPALRERTEQALACGALRPIGTRRVFVEEAGMRFVVRVAENLVRKAEDQAKRAKEPGGKPFNPFLPPEPELTVGEVGGDHVAVLNKFNVVENHLLIVTRRFEEQESLLTAGDFEALVACMAQYEGLGFYNGGTAAGASQRHKHLQLIPLPLAGSGPPLPVDPLLGEPGPEPSPAPGLPFRHLVSAVNWVGRGAAEAAGELHRRYLSMLEGLGVPPLAREGTRFQSAPYNLLLTRRWMMLVPRSGEFVETISVNAMGFAGSLFVRDETDLARLERIGPMEVLKRVSQGGSRD